MLIVASSTSFLFTGLHWNSHIAQPLIVSASDLASTRARQRKRQVPTGSSRFHMETQPPRGIKVLYMEAK